MDTPNMPVDMHTDDVLEMRAEAMFENRLDFLKELVDRRQKLGMTQAQVAELLGVTPQAVSKYERYDWDPRLSTLERYANAVGVVLKASITPCPWSSVGAEDTVHFTVTRTGETSVPIRNLVRHENSHALWSSAAESKRTDFALAG